MNDKQKELLMQMMGDIEQCVSTYHGIDEQEFEDLEQRVKTVFGLDYCKQLEIKRTEEKKKYIEFVKDVKVERPVPIKKVKQKCKACNGNVYEGAHSEFCVSCANMREESLTIIKSLQEDLKKIGYNTYVTEVCNHSDRQSVREISDEEKEQNLRAVNRQIDMLNNFLKLRRLI